MKKIIIIAITIFLLTSCSDENISENNVKINNNRNQLSENDELRINHLKSISYIISEYEYKKMDYYPDNLIEYSNYFPSIEKVSDIIKYYLTNYSNISQNDLDNGMLTSSSEKINGCESGLLYEVGLDPNGIPNNYYRLSVCIADKEKAKNDGGIYDNRYEIIIGTPGDIKDTKSVVINLKSK